MAAISDDAKTTLVLVAVLGFLAIVLMSLRLMMRKIRGQPFNLSDYFTMFAIFCLIGRSAFTTVVLVWENNNMSAAARAKYVFTDDDIYRRTVGSKLTLVNRAIYNTYIWIQKGVVLLLIHRMLKGLPWPERIMQVYWPILAVTLIGVQISCFVECSPVNLYWQVVPDPGTCVTAPIQLYVLVACNIFTDLMLIFLPMPFLVRIKRSWFQKIQLVGLFSIGFALIVIAVCRLPIYGSGTSQVNRNTLGSVEGFFAAFVANVPTLYTLRKDAATASRLTSSSQGQETTGSSGKRLSLKYGANRFRQISSKEEEAGILVTRDFELKTVNKNGPGYAASTAGVG